MGNLTARIPDLTYIVEVTKEDISQDYDLTTIEGVEAANEELINIFKNYNKKDFSYVKNNLFTLENSSLYIRFPK